MKNVNAKLKQTLVNAVLIAAVILSFPLLTGCASSGANEPAQKTDAQSQKKIQYTCLMHPEVVQDQPGDCPKCGMKLVEKH